MTDNYQKSILFIAVNNLGTGLSGGDRIFLEFIRYWGKSLKISTLGSPETKSLFKRYQLNTPFHLIGTESHQPIFFHTIRRLFSSVIFVLNNLSLVRSFDYIYSVSDFLPDLVPALIIKLVNPRIKWLAGYYLFAPNPFSPNSPYLQTGQFLKGLLYYSVQLATRPLVDHIADTVLITSIPDKKRFKLATPIVVRGGVDTAPSQIFFDSFSFKNIYKRQYDAVFQGRLHPQKGVLELIDIWKIVTQKRPSARLIIIGDGALENKVKQKIHQLKLKKNITLAGFLDGPKKYEIFKNSKIIVHPATYDSGGMSAAEGMAWGLPGVSFNLEALKTYYPKGMIKTPCFNKASFAQNIQLLISDKNIYRRYSQEARELILKHWSWEKQAKEIYRQVFKLDTI